MKHSAEMYRALRDCDVSQARRLWRHVAPAMPQPADDKEALRIIHYARTTMVAMPFNLRAYSHAWLVNNAWPSGLPDNMRPRAERQYPVVKAAVGIAMGSSSSIIRPALPIIRGAKVGAVMECYEEGRLDDTPFVKARMKEAKDYIMKKLFGRLESLKFARAINGKRS